MDRPVKRWEFLTGFVIFLIAVVTVGINIGNFQGKIITQQAQTQMDIVELKGRVGYMENFIQQHLDEKLDPIRKDLVDIKVLMQNKQDRKR